MARVVSGVLAALVLCTALASCGSGEPGGNGESPGLPPVEEYAPGQLIVKFAEGVAAGERDRVIAESGGLEVIEAIGPEREGTFLVRLEPGVEVPEAVERFERHGEVEYAEPNYLHSIQE